MRLPMRIVLATLCAVGCGGNYSNDDVDFQYAVPARADLEVKMPRLTVTGPVAEYYRDTRKGVDDFNGFIDAITNMVDFVRAHPPSERQGDTRIWGPFPVKEDPQFEARVRMQRMGREFYYWIEFRRRGDTPWSLLIEGTAIPNHNPMNEGIRRGRGTITYDLTQARAQSYPVDPSSELLKLVVTYQRIDHPHTVDLVATNIETAKSPGGTAQSRANADGSGSLTFVFRTPEGGVWFQALGLHSRWIAGGAGRADATVVEGFLARPGLVLATDCWGPDGAATFSFRDFEPKRREGDPATCVFPDAATGP
jgi:hypothetical protein